MNEDTTYAEFIQNIIDSRGRFACGDRYHETHHIIPKSMGGTNDRENLVDLFAQEHYEAHRLLAIENPNNIKIIYAWWMMSNMGGSKERNYVVSADEYAELKGKVSESMSGVNNPWYGKHSPRFGAHLTDEQKQHLRDVNLKYNARRGAHLSEDHKEALRNAHLGKKVSDVAKEHMRAAHIGKMTGVDHPNTYKVGQYDIDGNFIKTWDCAADAAKYYNINVANIRTACRRKILSNGFQWIKIDGDIEDKIPPYVNQNGRYQIKIVARCDEDWNIIDVWDGYTDAQKGTGVNRSKIGECCNGKRQHAGGYRWKILNENNE